MIKRVVLSFMAIILLTLALGGVTFAFAVRHYFYSGVAQVLLNRAEASDALYGQFSGNVRINRWGSPFMEALDSFRARNALVEILNPEGDLIASSSGLTETARVPLNSRIINGKETSRVERFPRTGEKVMAVYYPVQIMGKPYIIRYVSSLSGIDRELMLIYLGTFVCAVVIAALVFFISLRLAKSIVTPIRHIISASEEMASGNFNLRMKDHYSDELGVLAKTLNTMAEEIQKNDKLKNQFISSVSHELLTPLTGIRGWSETMIINHTLSPAELEEGLNVIKSESDRLQIIVRDLLNFSKLQGNNIKLNRAKMDIGVSVRQSAASLQIKAAEKRCILVTGENGRLSFTGDSIRLQQAIVNLIDNAIKFADDGSRISIDYYEENHQVIINVKDKGIVIDEKDLPYLTDAFYQVRANGRGSGLGLAISDQIVRLHGGKLTITSNKQEGTIATIRLPDYHC